ncbi:endonuclease/exonuclease/phosphatase family protein [Motiliproteus sp. MSK22-1]|uniref:endonuclease/exonuclease/phosphatase family protein n=1 Tax=Motiliproteus sp. MSK22-1 TaxID=1897630 RepID=UPI0009767765|nr:endonuclease/exonuclease/phosphatase family protein [Motiliproteus sp. MSK22-1]OMH26587.1 hypothetical protein BGP75_23085 [Motiliproteus sp. MSK22-1]
MRRAFTLITLLMIAANVQALTVMSINTEWFWDEEKPHEGTQPFGPKGKPPSTKQVELKALALAQIINQNKADIVGLAEVEGRAVVKRIIPYLDGEWNIAFRQGRDSKTGQDVALITKLDLIAGTVTNFPDAKGVYKGRQARPTKVLGVGLRQNGQKYFVVMTHFISKHDKNDKKRSAQANAVARAVVKQARSYDHMIVMGDMNDTPNSVTLRQIRSAGLTLISGEDDYSYVYKGKKELIDHVLVSKSLAEGASFKSVDLGPISDHHAVVATLK